MSGTDLNLSEQVQGLLSPTYGGVAAVTQGNEVLPSSSTQRALDTLEVSSQYSLEIPATSRLEVLASYFGVVPATAGGTGVAAPGPSGYVLTSTGSLWASKSSSPPPSYVTGALNKYDSTFNLYNLKASNTRRIRAGVGKALVGQTLSHHVFIGDSETLYSNGAGPDHLNMWPRMLQKTLSAQSGVQIGGTGVVPVANVDSGGGAYLDPRWVITSGTWTNNATFLQSSTSGAKLTFTSDTAGTTVDVGFFGNSSGFTVAIDGGTPVAASPSGTVVMNHYTVTGLANTTHTVVITTSSTSGVAIVSCNVSQTTGYVIHNLGSYGSTASGTGSSAWADTSNNAYVNYARLQSLPASITPDCVWICLGVNDNAQGYSASTFTAALTTLRNQWPNSDAILVAEYEYYGAINYPQWVAALYGLADTLDVPLLDLYDRSGGYAIASGNGLMGDSVHPTEAGQRDWGLAAAKMVIG